MGNNNWINVQDGPPEDGDDVLVYTSDEYIMMAEYVRGEWRIYHHPYIKRNGPATHWRPLPKPPKTNT